LVNLGVIVLEGEMGVSVQILTEFHPESRCDPKGRFWRRLRLCLPLLLLGS
jgi:hypothetical protein